MGSGGGCKCPPPKPLDLAIQAGAINHHPAHTKRPVATTLKGATQATGSR